MVAMVIGYILPITRKLCKEYGGYMADFVCKHSIGVIFQQAELQLYSWLYDCAREGLNSWDSVCKFMPEKCETLAIFMELCVCARKGVELWLNSWLCVCPREGVEL